MTICLLLQVWQALSNLVSSDVSARDQFNRARDFVTMLNAFEFPPAPTDAAASILVCCNALFSVLQHNLFEPLQFSA